MERVWSLEDNSTVFRITALEPFADATLVPEPAGAGVVWMMVLGLAGRRRRVRR